MPDEQYLFDYKEIVETLVKKQGIREGEWRLLIEFGLGANNVPVGDNKIAPAVINIIQKIGIKRAEQPSNLSVNAAEVNPALNGAKKIAAKKAGGKKQQR